MNRSSRILSVGVALATLGLLAGMPKEAHAQAFLVGFELFAPDSTGNNQGSGYTYTTNSNINFARQTLSLNGGPTQTTAISFLLGAGNNSFTFTPPNSFPTSIAGINLFFNSTGTSFNPTAGAAVAGNLTAVANTNNSGSFFFPIAGTSVRNYDTGLTDAPYSGATFFNVGGQRITLTQYSVNNTPAGTFTLNVAPTAGVTAPEPGSVALLFTGVLPLAGLVARRRSTRT